jgi:hypothetical protein
LFNRLTVSEPTLLLMFIMDVDEKQIVTKPTSKFDHIVNNLLNAGDATHPINLALRGDKCNTLRQLIDLVMNADKVKLLTYVDPISHAEKHLSDDFIEDLIAIPPYMIFLQNSVGPIHEGLASIYGYSHNEYMDYMIMYVNEGPSAYDEKTATTSRDIRVLSSRHSPHVTVHDLIEGGEFIIEKCLSAGDRRGASFFT